MTQNITKRQGKRKRKGKDTCDAAFLCAFVSSLYFPLSLSLAVLVSGLASGREDQKKKKKRKMEEDERKKNKKTKKSEEKGGRSSSASWIFFFFFSRDRTVDRSLSPDRFPHKEKKRKGRAENRSRDYIYIYI